MVLQLGLDPLGLRDPVVERPLHRHLLELHVVAAGLQRRVDDRSELGGVDALHLPAVDVAVSVVLPPKDRC